ncbi:MAG: hypothetical protein IMZ50_16460 [Candidatus Atribacteria bacterium]|nr:hypothetical protein [Candidatus Atribacteria bacterium]
MIITRCDVCNREINTREEPVVTITGGGEVGGGRGFHDLCTYCWREARKALVTIFVRRGGAA